MFQRECCVRRENGSDVGFGRGGEGLLRWSGSREGNLAVFGLVSKVVGFANRKVHMNIRHNWRSRSSHIPQLAPHPLRQHADQHIGAGALHQHRISMLPTFKYKPPTANATTPVTKVPHFQQTLIKALVMPWVVRSSMGGWSSIVTATGRKGGERRGRLNVQYLINKRIGYNRNNCGQRPSNRLVGFSRSSQLFHVPSYSASVDITNSLRRMLR